MEDDKKCCENCDNCNYCGCGRGMMFDCCHEHKMSKEHLQNKKKMLEEKMKWVDEKLKEASK